jgi:hypothetical protein
MRRSPITGSKRRMHALTHPPGIIARIMVRLAVRLIFSVTGCRCREFEPYQPVAAQDDAPEATAMIADTGAVFTGVVDY